MVSRTHRKKRKQARDTARKRFIKAKRKNLLADRGARDMVIILDGLKTTFNIGKVFRTADAFGARKIHLVGTDFFDPAPAKGSFHHVPAVFDAIFADTYGSLAQEEYKFFIFSPHGGKPLNEVELPEKSAFIFGHEEFGFSFNPTDYADLNLLHIPQVGKVESLNVSIAASIAMYEYVRQHPEIRK